MFKRKTNEEKYQAFLKKIKKAFVSLLVSSYDIPNLKDKILVNVENIDDLVDTALSVRKPIYYIEQEDMCDFILLHDDQACIYTLKASSDKKSRLENYLLELEESKKKKDTKFLEDIDKTMIIETGDGNLFKVSPIKGKEERERKRNIFDTIQLPKLKRIKKEDK